MIQYLYLGRVGYDEGLRLQAEIAALAPRAALQNVCCCWNIRRC